MQRNYTPSAGAHLRSWSQSSARAIAKQARRAVTTSQRARVPRRHPRLPFVPPEDWHESQETGDGYRFICQEPGPGFMHVLTPDDVAGRLEALPESFVRALEVVQFSRMTRKKQTFPCYGMQWGTAIYLYPIEESLVEFYGRPPKPAQRQEAEMYGGRWSEQSPGVWQLHWTIEAIRNFYLHNILIHELGHLLDNRNTRSVDRERFAEWFSLEYGYKPYRASQTRARGVVRRHG